MSIPSSFSQHKSRIVLLATFSISNSTSASPVSTMPSSVFLSAELSPVSASSFIQFSMSASLSISISFSDSIFSSISLSENAPVVSLLNSTLLLSEFSSQHKSIFVIFATFERSRLTDASPVFTLPSPVFLSAEFSPVSDSISIRLSISASLSTSILFSFSNLNSTSFSE